MRAPDDRGARARATATAELAMTLPHADGSDTTAAAVDLAAPSDGGVR